ncbi:Uncharacterised protein [Mycolicibacterium vanbaalenii]|uniref:Uncharacterized protein n=1 Tax=Mycolicibacterium vanbaalenii TaxID=110539 RepID=A0A5S9R4H8_MYCVN|nr:Uncharacterised protein [Mycolicibacterium vanbaalenii]
MSHRIIIPPSARPVWTPTDAAALRLRADLARTAELEPVVLGRSPRLAELMETELGR